MKRQFITDNLAMKLYVTEKIAMTAVSKQYKYSDSYKFRVYHVVCNECSSFFDTAHIEDTVTCSVCNQSVDRKDIHIVDLL